jgi:hypothetical protein
MCLADADATEKTIGYAYALARISHRDPEFWGKLAKQVGRSPAEP